MESTLIEILVRCMNTTIMITLCVQMVYCGCGTKLCCIFLLAIKSHIQLAQSSGWALLLIFLPLKMHLNILFNDFFLGSKPACTDGVFDRGGTVL